MKKETCVKKLPLKPTEEYSNGNNLVKSQEANVGICVEEASVETPSSPSAVIKSTNSAVILEGDKNMEKTTIGGALRTKSEGKKENKRDNKKLASNDVSIASQGDNVSNSKVEDGDSNAKKDEGPEGNQTQEAEDSNSLPKRKKKAPKKPSDVTFRCDVCNLDLSSENTLNIHVAGSKHQKKQKSKEVMDYLEKTESGFEQDPMSGVIRCVVCDITVNSPQLLAAHVSSKKHKSKRDGNVKRKIEDEEGEGEDETLAPAKKVRPEVTSQSNGSNNETREEITGSKVSSAAATPKKKKKASVQINIPSCDTKDEETKGAGQFFCTSCQVPCNSDVQFHQHVTSKKHIAKMSGMQE